MVYKTIVSVLVSVTLLGATSQKMVKGEVRNPAVKSKVAVKSPIPTSSNIGNGQLIVVKRKSVNREVLNKVKNPVSHAAKGNLSEGFESGDIPSNWTVIDADGDGNEWQAYNNSSYAHSGDYSATIHWNASGNDDWLITPRLIPANGDSFVFWARSRSSSWLEHFQVLVSTTDTSTASFHDTIADVDNVPDSYTRYAYSLNSYVGDTIYVAIRCISNDKYYLHVDDVSGPQVYAPYPDISNDSLVAPDTVDEGATVTVTAYVSNKGGANSGTFWEIFSVNGNKVDSTTLSLDPDEQTTVNFSYTPSNAGEDTLMVFSKGVTGDPTADNDTATKYVWVNPQNDAGVSSYDTLTTFPLVTGDIDTIFVWVRNYGTRDQNNLKVYLEVLGEGLVDSTVVSVASNDSTRAGLTWQPRTCGKKTLKFYSKLAGDEVASNDTLTMFAYPYCTTTLTEEKYVENFEGEFPPNKWFTKNLDGDSYTWTNSTNAYQGTYSARTPVDASGNYPNNSLDALYSPLIDIGTYHTLTAMYAHLDSLESNYDYVRVFVKSYAGFDDPAPVLDTIAVHTGRAAGWEVDTHIVSGLRKYNVFIWELKSDYSYNYAGFFLDTLVIYGTLVHDVGVVSILSPNDTTKVGANIAPAVEIANFGDYSENPQVIVYIIKSNSDTVYVDTTSTSISPHDTTVVSLAPWTVHGRNGDELNVFAYTVITSDANHDNDTLSKQTTLYSTGGSDPYGWHWYSSDDPSGPTYSWIELYPGNTQADSIKALTPGDDGEEKIPLTKPFKFYGSQYDSVYVGSNGGLDFINNNVSAFNNKIPTTTQKKFIAPFWDDLKCADTTTANGDSTIYVGYFGDTLTVIEWYQVPRYGSTRKFTFEVLLYTRDKNDIVFQYKDMSAYSPDNDNTTIGIQDSAGHSNGSYILYTYDEKPFTPNWAEKGGYAIQFVNPEVATGVGENPGSNLPRAFELFAPFPNPAGSDVSIRFAVPEKRHVDISVYDVTGRKVTTLASGKFNPGYHVIKWNGKAETGARVKAGVYFIKFEAEGTNQVKKLVITR